MLRELLIENLAIIEKLNLEFGDGLITLTGETGAGKSIILNGINLLLGEKASIDMLRSGEKQLVAQGVFEVNNEQKNELEKLDIEVENDEVIIRRTLDAQGKEKSYVNGARVPRTRLKEVMKSLVDIVGQHSHQMLLNKENHIKLLDKFIEEETVDIRKKIEFSLEKYSEVCEKIKEIEKEKNETAEKKEFYEFQLDEIEKANLKVGEDIDLENEYKLLFNAGKIKEKLSISEFQLKNDEINALDIIYSCKKQIEAIVDYGKDFEEIYEQIERVYYDLEDCVSTIEQLESDIEIDEHRLEEVVSRLNLIEKLKNKYGSTIEEILEFAENISSKLRTLDDNNYQTSLLEKEREKYKKDYWDAAFQLREVRKKFIKKIEENLGKELDFLNMKNAKLDIKLEEKEIMSKNGSDTIEFFITTNIGQPPKPLQKIASGGEVSRIMLALKVIFSHVDNIPILIFDEIDTGVGGETVRKIAEKLKEIGKNAQVICITHSPAIASKAHEQYYIEKNIKNGTTFTSVKKLSDKERIYEIARMLAGESISDSVLKHAEELLNEE
ncbi:DNA repair protein RecN [Fusobacterium perfoetens]|uniref:DNA repair protein RecN n=1 Tax=Fusobacterium perfoetens TaxID=852 RepID=UPI000483FBCC|nr:DNA repair protein RecN [Fusobacterium perfoetens]MCI6153175.1 DNA repair protein RecN [Fusobacterium perfoetens]MDY3237105.1 DNA repair protein RecN [Fusobacterium perfoetens]